MKPSNTSDGLQDRDISNNLEVMGNEIKWCSFPKRLNYCEQI